MPTWSAHASVAWATVVEVSPPAEKWVDRALLTRLIELELSDVDVPPPPAVDAEVDAPGLYVRIRRVRGRVVVELWDRGQRQGQRRLVPSDSRALTARRIALASGELASRLRDQRLSERRAAVIERRRLADELARPKPPNISARPFVAAELGGGAALDGGALLWGPRVRSGLTFGNGGEVAMGAALSAGAARELDGEPRLQWFELSAGAGRWFDLERPFRWRVGADAAVAAVHVADATIWSEAGGVSETWSARATGQLRVCWLLDSSVGLDAFFDAGAVLRKVWLDLGEGERDGVGGLWLGAGVGVTVF